MSQQTAVEWLIEQLIKYKLVPEGTHHDNVLFNKAKQMEKDQLNIARLDGINLSNKGYGSKNTSSLPNVNPDDVIPSSPQFVKQTII